MLSKSEIITVDQNNAHSADIISLDVITEMPTVPGYSIIEDISIEETLPADKT